MRNYIVALLLTFAVAPADAAALKCGDALKEVNRARAQRGLRPFKRSAKLSLAAMGAAKYRAKRLMAGHTANDFRFLPKGGRATAAGCAAWGRHDGWGACCTYENHRYAGAAWAIGRDGRRYMQLFVK